MDVLLGPLWQIEFAVALTSSLCFTLLLVVKRVDLAIDKEKAFLPVSVIGECFTAECEQLGHSVCTTF